MPIAEHKPTASAHASPGGGAVVVRPLAATDPITAITDLLHRAYGGQRERGLDPLAGRQSVEVTRRRCYRGQTLVALRPGVGASPSADFARRLVGTILFQEREDAAFPAWFLRAGVTHFSQFAVEPTAQGLGVGRALLSAVERMTLDMGGCELALSMAAPDAALRAYYARRGFRQVQTWQWPYTNYQSLILSKPVGRDP